MQKTIHAESYRALLRWLRAARKARGLSMRALAAGLDVPHTWVGKIEQAERRMDLLEYVRLCLALELDPMEGLRMILPAGYNAAARRCRKAADRHGPRYPLLQFPAQRQPPLTCAAPCVPAQHV